MYRHMLTLEEFNKNIFCVFGEIKCTEFLGILSSNKIRELRKTVEREGLIPVGKLDLGEVK